MKLPDNAVIAREKLTHYLLVHRPKDDKSAWLASAGYTLENVDLLLHDIRARLLSQPVTEIKNGEYGEIFIVNGNLRGPNGLVIAARSIWLKDFLSEEVRFVTLYPRKQR